MCFTFCFMFLSNPLALSVMYLDIGVETHLNILKTLYNYEQCMYIFVYLCMWLFIKNKNKTLRKL